MARLTKHTDLLAAAGVVLIVLMLVIPLPAELLDIFIALNIAAGLAILTATLYLPRALDFAAFPSLLLITTMFRLAINVSVTRLILLHGDAGHMVKAFGDFVVGGNVVVGLIIFFILVIIQFVVVTNGAGRVSEVAARFTLDAMPGKQMAIDADLNAGQISDEEARLRREEIAREAEFYGAMDGASKFVKGDAIAAVIITIINLLGGIVVGVAQQGMPMSEAAQTFSLLTVGDGLAAQIPALLVSIATGIIVTRSASEKDLGNDVAHQIANNRKAPLVAGAAMLTLALIPGLPKMPFIVIGAIFLAIGWRLKKSAEAREAAEAARAERDARLTQVRAEVDALAAELAQLTDVAHRDEVARAQQELRVDQLRTRALEELGIDPDVLVEEYGPHQPVPVVPAPGQEADDDAPRTVPYVREEQEKRLRRAERDLAMLGRVNPLALEEFAALEERHAFLAEQLADLKKSRADLLAIVKEIDERVEKVFVEAYEDTAREFEQVFARLFPGGEGRLVLTDPENMLTTGVEVEARPAGKKVKRLSLLSGGERSLTAVALLVAIFRARPSPFYVMDEVEAALDDTNLGRLLEIFRELREDSQLIVVTHQKRTMEIADALYGVTMRDDGVTTVISQRLREEATA